MTPYERIVSAVQHRRADRLPIDYVATPEAHAALKAYLQIDDDEALRKRLGSDLRRVEAHYVGPSDRSGAAGVAAGGEDFLGIVWKPVRNEFGTYSEIAHHPLAQVTTVKEVEEYP